MAKEVAAFIKLQIKGGAANPSPPVGPALGSKGVNIMDFCKQFNARTQDKAGKVLPVIITVYSDKSFDFVVKQPPVAIQLKEAAKIQSGSAQPNRQKVGQVTWDQVKEIAEGKMPDMNCFTIEAALVGQIPIIIRNIPNVLGFLGETKEDSQKMNAAPLRPQEVARILGRVDELSAMEEENEIPYVVGETVKVTDGPFSSFQGTIEAVDNERKKLTVSVKIFGRKTPMELSFTQVEKE